MNKQINGKLFFKQMPELLRCQLLEGSVTKLTASNYIYDQMSNSEEALVWLYTTQGVGGVETEKGSVILHTGKSLLLQFPGLCRYYVPDDSKSWRFIKIAVGGQEALRIMELFMARGSNELELTPDNKLVELANRIVSSISSGELVSPYLSSAMAYEFIMNICELNPPRELNSDSEVLDKVRSFCLNNLNNRISVAQMAKVAGWSKWHFSRRFVELSGFSPHDFVLDIKMRRAIHMLSANLPIKSIVDELGFSSSAYFCRAFRRTYGVSPGEFRRNRKI